MSLIDHVRRIVADEAKGTVTNPRPLYAAAGAVDLAVDFVRGVPERMEKVADQLREEWTAERFGDAFSDLVHNAGPADVRARGEQLREKVSATLRDRRDSVVDELADLSADARDLPAQVRNRARQAPGRAVAEIANQVGAAYEMYDTFVDRGKVAVAKLRGDAVPGQTPTPANRAPSTDPITPVTRPRSAPSTPRSPVSPSSVAPGSVRPVPADSAGPVGRPPRTTPGGAPAPTATAPVTPTARTTARKASARKSAPSPAAASSAPGGAKPRKTATRPPAHLPATGDGDGAAPAS